MTSTLPNDYSSKEAWGNAYKNIAARVGALPGVRQAAITDFLPLTDRTHYIPFSIPDREKQGTAPVAMLDRITPSYFKTLGIPILRGRNFDERDKGKRRAIIDAAVAGIALALLSSASMP
jgi:putative ABC transport system permease protein